jgi:uncharacterized protein YfaP (DUF2135 family)
MYKRMVALTIITILIMSLAGCGGGGQSALPAKTLMWAAPTTNTDGSPIIDLAGYKIYYGTVSGRYTASIDVGNVTSFSVTALSSSVPLPGSYYIAVTAYDTAGNESVYSNEISLNLAKTQ